MNSDSPMRSPGMGRLWLALVAAVALLAGLLVPGSAEARGPAAGGPPTAAAAAVEGATAAAAEARKKKAKNKKKKRLQTCPFKSKKDKAKNRKNKNKKKGKKHRKRETRAAGDRAWTRAGLPVRATADPPAPDDPDTADDPNPPAVIPGEIVVDFADQVPEDVQECMADTVGAAEVSEIPGGEEINLLRLDDVTAPVDAVVDRLEAKSDHVETAVPNFVADYADYNDPEWPTTDAQDSREDAKQWFLRWAPYVPFPAAKNPKHSLADKVFYAGTGVEHAWQTTTGNRAVRIGVVDSGVSAVADLTPGGGVPNNLNNLAATNLGAPPTADDRGHGSRVAALIAGMAGNGFGGIGIMQRAAILPYSVEERGGGFYGIIEGLQYMAARDVPVVNLSMATRVQDREQARQLDGLFASFLGLMAADHPDTLIVAGAGNEALNLDEGPANPSSVLLRDGTGTLWRTRLDFYRKPTIRRAPKRSQVPANVTDAQYTKLKDNLNKLDWQPCAVRSARLAGEQLADLGRFAGDRPNLLCVAASDTVGQLASFSNYGPDTVDLAAPGVKIRNVNPGVRPVTYSEHQGTSYAAPIVSGIAGLAKSAFPGITAAQLKCVVLESAHHNPLPPQRVSDVEHPAFLQPQDRPQTLDRVTPVTQAAPNFVPGAGRVLGGQPLLRVSGIANAFYAVEEAGKLALAQGNGNGGGHRCSLPIPEVDMAENDGDPRLDIEGDRVRQEVTVQDRGRSFWRLELRLDDGPWRAALTKGQYQQGRTYIEVRGVRRKAFGHHLQVRLVTLDRGRQTVYDKADWLASGGNYN